MRTHQIARLFMALVMIGGSFHVPVLAQNQPPGSEPPDRKLDLDAVCMARVLRDVPQVRGAQQGGSFKILVVRASLPSLKSKGFVEIDCGEAKLRSAQQQTAYRDSVCELAATGNQAVQAQYEQALGERPAVLCANAQLATGVQRGAAPSARG
jgi:hypothetical protein